MTLVPNPARGRAIVRWIAFIAAPCSIWPLLAWVHRERPMSPDVRVLRDAATDADRRDASYEIRFRADPSEHEQWAIYLPSLGMNAAVYLNGSLIGDGGRFEEPIARNWNRPLLFPFARSLLAPSEDTLLIHVRGDGIEPMHLGPVYLGSEQALSGHFHRRHALKVTTVWVMMLCLVAVAIFMAALWSQRRDEPYYGWFAAGAAAWAAMCLNLVIVNVPVSTLTWYGLWYGAIIAWGTLLNRFLLAFVADESRLVPRIIDASLVTGVGVVAVLTALGSSSVYEFTRAWMGLVLLGSLYATTRTIGALRAEGHRLEIAVPHVLGACIFPSAVHDWIVLARIDPRPGDYFVPYAALPVLAGMGWALLRRFVDALEHSESLVADLADRVRNKREELDRSYVRLREVERGRVLEVERERIMREMHDGLGSHLVSTLSLIQGSAPSRESIGEAIRAAIDELRLVVESLEPLDGDLIAALAMLRARMQPRFEAARIAVVWEVSDLPILADLQPGRVLQVLRIAQEAFSNVLKHARARTITVRTGVATSPAGPVIFLEIGDDGGGIGTDGGSGRGLAHMRRRAAELGARLELHSAPSGTRVRLALPIDLPVDA